MSLQSLVPWLLMALTASGAGMVYAAANASGAMHAAAAAAFGFVLAGMALWVNRPYWRPRTTPAPLDDLVMASRRNARLMMFAYAWGAAAMAADYSLTTLDWRHDWQYALAMGIAATVCLIYAVLVVRPRSIFRRPELLRWMAVTTTVQGGLALIGVVYLVASGKLWTFRSDWAANHIFLIGGLLLALLSALALRTYRKLTAAG